MYFFNRDNEIMFHKFWIFLWLFLCKYDTLWVAWHMHYKQYDHIETRCPFFVPCRSSIFELLRALGFYSTVLWSRFCLGSTHFHCQLVFLEWLGCIRCIVLIEYYNLSKQSCVGKVKRLLSMPLHHITCIYLFLLERNLFDLFDLFRLMLVVFYFKSIFIAEFFFKVKNAFIYCNNRNCLFRNSIILRSFT